MLDCLHICLFGCPPVCLSLLRFDYPLIVVFVCLYVHTSLSICLPQKIPPSSGSNYGYKFQSNPTSYDYNAPVSEAGDPTQKYFVIRDVVGKVSDA